MHAGSMALVTDHKRDVAEPIYPLLIVGVVDCRWLLSTVSSRPVAIRCTCAAMTAQRTACARATHTNTNASNVASMEPQPLPTAVMTNPNNQRTNPLTKLGSKQPSSHSADNHSTEDLTTNSN
jgi:hypothetical protein